MTFEDELRRAFDTLTERLRHELDSHARAALDELAQSARAERDEAIARAEAAARADRDEAVAQAEAAAAAQRDEAIAKAEAAIRAEAEARAEAAAHDEAAARAAAVEAARAEAEARAEEALREREAEWRSHLDAAPKPVAPAAGAESLAQLADGIRAMAAAATLRGVLEALVRAAGADGSTASIWLLRSGRLTAWTPDGAGHAEEVGVDGDRAIAAAARNNAAALRDGVEQAFPLTLAGEVVAVVGVSAATRKADAAPVPAETLEILSRYASRALEAITAFKTARAVVQTPAEPAGSPVPLADGGSDAEDHASAQRYAKLLVSEIKLYHEADVVEGRRDRDLMARLGGEIAHARVMYEQRVPRHIRERADYFHDELVRTLANGDASLLEVRT